MLHSENNKLFPDSQSAYCQFHLTETAVCIVHNDLVRAMDRVTALLELSLVSVCLSFPHLRFFTIANDLTCVATMLRLRLLVMFDLSAAFDTVDHSVLLEVLTNRFSVGGVALPSNGSIPISVIASRHSVLVIRNLICSILRVQFHKAQFLDWSNTSLTLKTLSISLISMDLIITCMQMIYSCKSK